MPRSRKPAAIEPPGDDQLLTLVWGDVMDEMERAIEAHPTTPTDPVRRVALVVEEVGEAMKEALDATRGPIRPTVADRVFSERTYEELVHTAAVAIRMLMAMRGESL